MISCESHFVKCPDSALAKGCFKLVTLEVPDQLEDEQVLVKTANA